MQARFFSHVTQGCVLVAFRCKQALGSINKLFTILVFRLCALGVCDGQFQIPKKPGRSP
jgi:hypothetical protein